MRIQFLEDIIVDFESSICCFSGFSDRSKIKYKKDEIIEIESIQRNEKRKGGRLLTVFFQSDYNSRELHPNRLLNVPEKSIEVLE